MNSALAQTGQTLIDIKPTGLEPTARVDADIDKMFVNALAEGLSSVHTTIHDPLVQDFRFSANRIKEPSIIPIPQPPKISFHFQVLQQWEGTVLDTEDESVVVRLRDLASAEAPEKRATISKDEISESDIDLVKVGAVFYWIIGYRIELYGRKSMVSTIKFRRLPSWTRRDLKRIDERASELDLFFDTSF